MTKRASPGTLTVLPSPSASQNSKQVPQPLERNARRVRCRAPTTGRPGHAASKERSDTDALCKQLAVVRRVAEEDLGALRPLEVEVGVVLPGEADSAVDLDVLGRGVEVRVGAVGLREARRHR